MSNSSKSDINQQIKNYKINRIAEAEEKLDKFKKAYDEIKQNVIIKVSKNSLLNFFRVILVLLLLVLIVIFIYSFFPEKYIYYMEKKEHTNFSIKMREMIEVFFKIARAFSFILIVLLYVISKLLKQNVKSRNIMYNLNLLLKEVIDYFSVASEEEKRKYEYFIDSLNDVDEKVSNNETGNHI